MDSKQLLGNESKSDKNDSLNYWLVFVDKCEVKFGRAYCNYASLMVLIGFFLQMLVLSLVITRIRALGARFRNQYNLSFLWLCSIALTVYVDLIEFVFSHDGHVQSRAITLVNCVFFVLAVWTMFEFWRYYDVEGMNNSWIHFLSTLFSICLAVVIGISRIWAYKHADDSPDPVLVNRAVKSYTFLYFWVYAIFGFAQIHSNIRNNFARCFTQSGYSCWLIGSYMMSYYTVLLDKKLKYDYVHYKNYFQVTTLIYIVLQEVITRQVKARNQKILQSVYEQSNIPMKETSLERNEEETVDAEIQMTEPSDRNSSQYESFRFSDSKVPQLGRTPSDKDGVDICFDAQQYDRGTVQNNLNVYGYDQSDFNSTRALNSGDSPLRSDRPTRWERWDDFFKRHANLLLCMFIGLLTFQLFFSAYLLLKVVSSSLLALTSILVHPAAFLFGYLFKNYSFMIFK